jgi:methyltransferase (TIGR00027 family)
MSPGSSKKPSPSRTAFFVALRRALANKAYPGQQFGPDDLAQYFLPAHYRFLLRLKGVRRNAMRQLSAAMPGMTEYVIARTAYFDRLFLSALNDCTPQIVILGAGYDTRAYRFASANRSTVIFELDAAETQERKMECLRHTRISVPESVRFVPTDFTAEPLSAVLEKAGYRPQAGALFLWEGVSYYLDARSVDETLWFVSRAASADSAIAFDYTIPLTAENVQGRYGSAEFLAAMQGYHADEALMFSIAEGEVASFLGERDMQVIEHFDPESIEKTFLVDAQGALLGRVTGNFRFVLAKPIGLVSS